MFGLPCTFGVGLAVVRYSSILFCSFSQKLAVMLVVVDVRVTHSTSNNLYTSKLIPPKQPPTFQPPFVLHPFKQHSFKQPPSLQPSFNSYSKHSHNSQHNASRSDASFIFHFTNTQKPYQKALKFH